jgi:hypothetical protein
MTDDEAEVVEIFGRERRDVQVGIGEVQALLAPDPTPLGRRPPDLDDDAIRPDLDHVGPDPAVVDEHPRAHLEALHDSGQRAADQWILALDAAVGIGTEQQEIAFHEPLRVGPRRVRPDGPHLRPAEVHEHTGSPRPAGPALGGA